MMNLNEAILLGALMKPQGYGTINYPHKSCGLQAGLDAVGRGEDLYVFREAVKVWPWLNQNIECPWCMRNHAIYDIIGRCLNDKAKWTRQKIAKWVATVEPVEATTSNPIQEVIHETV